MLGDCAQYLDDTLASHNHADTATQYWLRSSSAADTADGGAGARQVRIVAIMSDGGQEARDVNLNGVTGVFLDAGYSSFQWAEVTTAGSGDVAAGNITVSDAGSAAPVTGQIVEYIAAGGNRSLSGHFHVPANKTAYITAWDSTSVGAASMDVRLRAQTNADDDSASEAYHFKDTNYLTSGQSAFTELPYIKVPAGSAIKVSAIPSNATAGNRLDCGFTLLVVDD